MNGIPQIYIMRLKAWMWDGIKTRIKVALLPEQKN